MKNYHPNDIRLNDITVNDKWYRPRWKAHTPGDYPGSHFSEKVHHANAEVVTDFLLILLQTVVFMSWMKLIELLRNRKQSWRRRKWRSAILLDIYSRHTLTSWMVNQKKLPRATKCDDFVSSSISTNQKEYWNFQQIMWKFLSSKMKFQTTISF